MCTWESFDDIEYRGYFLSVYVCFTTARQVIEYEIRVREGLGQDESGGWLKSLYIARFPRHFSVYGYGGIVRDGKKFVDYYLGDASLADYFKI